MSVVDILGRVIPPALRPSPPAPPNNTPPPALPPAPTLPVYRDPPAVTIGRLEDDPDVIAATRRLNELGAARGNANAAYQQASRNVFDGFDAKSAGQAIVDGAPAPATVTRADAQAAHMRLEALEEAVNLQRKKQSDAVDVAALRFCQELYPRYLAAARELAVALVAAVEAREKLFTMIETMRRDARLAGPLFSSEAGVGGFTKGLTRKHVEAFLGDSQVRGFDLLARHNH